MHASAEAALANLFGVDDVPASAALSRLGEGDLGIEEVRAHRWLRADPAWIRADISGARVLGIGPMLRPSASEAERLADALHALFAEEGIALQAVRPDRWYLRLPPDAVLPRFATPAEVLGDDAFDHRPQGETARFWRRLESEAQVILHQSPANATRQEPINALWFWGEAGLPDAIERRVPMLASDDPLLRGLARLANIDLQAMPTQWHESAEGLIDLRATATHHLLDAWLSPALIAMQQGGRSMQWICEEGPVFELRRGQRLRFWRRPKDAAALSSTDAEAGSP